MVAPVESDSASPMPPYPSSQFWLTLAPWVVATSMPLPPMPYMMLPLTRSPRPGDQAPVHGGCQAGATSGRRHQFDDIVTALPPMPWMRLPWLTMLSRADGAAVPAACRVIPSVTLWMSRLASAMPLIGP